MLAVNLALLPVLAFCVTVAAALVFIFWVMHEAKI